jgi:hypothetical protein
MNKRLPALLAAALALPALASAQTTTTSAALWTEFQATPYTHSHIPNVSFAGYQRGEVPIPDVPVVANVLDFGAVGDGETFNDAAFLRAMNAANQAGGGAVWIPNGHYLLRNTMLVHHSGVVLRGESRDGVILNFTRPLIEAPGFGSTGHGTQHYNWMGGLIWVSPRNPYFNLRSDESAIWNWNTRDLQPPDFWTGPGNYENWRAGAEITTVPTPHPAGVRTLTVADGSGLQPGDFVFMTWEDPKEGPHTNALFMEMAGHSAFDGYNFGSWLNGMPYHIWPVEIAHVDGNEVTLMQPIRLSIETYYNVRIRAVSEHVREIGLENFTILMDNTRESYPYNNGVGWNGIYFNQVYNSWAQDIKIVNSEASLHVSASKNLTVRNIAVESSVQSKYIFTSRVQTSDVLFDTFSYTGTGQINNGINTELFSTGNVFTRGEMGLGTFDSHRMMAFDYVRTDIWMTNPRDSRPGGDGNAGPFTGRRGVHWNITIDHDALPEWRRRDPGAEAEWVFEPFQYSMGAQIGIRGADMFEKSNLFAMPSGDKGMLIGDVGIVPTPANLYDAQVALRHSTEASIIPAIRSLWFIPVDDVTIPVVAHPPVGTTIAEVRAYLDGDLIATSSSAPYTLSWNNPVPGRYWLEMELFDNLGGSTWSAPREVVIGQRVILEHNGPINYRPDFEVVEHPFFRQGKAMLRDDRYATGSTMEFSFTGTRARVWGQRGGLNQRFEVFLNGEFLGETVHGAAVMNKNHAIWDSGDLPDGHHTVRFRLPVDTARLLVDYIEITSTEGGPGERRAPQPIAGLTAEPVSNTEVALSWHRVSPYESGHRIERSSDGGVNWDTLGTLPAGQHQFLDTAASAGGTYQYRVIAFNSFGEETPEEVATATTPTDQGLLTVPQNLAATPFSSDRMELTWTYSGSGHTGFRVERRMGNQSWSLHSNVPPSARNLRDINLFAGESYSYRIRAYSGSDFSPFTPAVTATIPSGLDVLPTTAPLTWFMQSSDGSGSITENTPTRVAFGGDEANASRGVVAALGTPISLDEAGDFIEMIFRTEGMPTPNSSHLILRFGLFNDNGQPVAADFSSVTDDSLGFFGALSTGGRDHAIAAQGSGEAQILGRGRATAADLNFGGMTRLQNFSGFNGGQRQVILRLERQADGSVSVQMQSRDQDVRYLIMQGSVPAASVPTYTFNQIAFALGNGNYTGLTITDIIVHDSSPGEDLAPTFTLQPQSVSVGEGGFASFSAQAVGFPAPTYQWFKDGVAIPDATGASLLISNVSIANEGSYHVVASNGIEPDAVSASAQLSVVPLPVITVQPQPANLAIVEGAALNLSVSAESEGTITYQWRRNGVPVPDGSASTFSIANISRANAGTYRVLVSNEAGGVLSDAVVVDVHYPPAIVEQPVSVTVLLGDEAALSVVSEANPTAQYQWFRNGDPVPGATDALLEFEAVTLADLGDYFVRVSNSVATIDSQTVTLAQFVPPAPPADLAVSAVTHDSISLSWTDNSGGQATGFTVHAGDGSLLATLGEGVTSHTVTGLEPSTPYTFTVRGFNIAGSSGDSEPVSATTDPVFTLSFAANGADGSAPAPMVAPAGAALSLPGQGALTKEGHAFNGWRDVLAAATYATGDSFVMPANDITLDAQWTVVEEEPIVVHQFNFGANAYTGTNSPGHANWSIPLSVDEWTTVNGNDIQFAPGQFVRFRRGNGAGDNAGVTLTQTSNANNRSSATATGVFDTALGKNWRAYVRGGFAGRSVGAWFEGLPHGDYIVYAVVHNPVLITDGRTTNVGIGTGSQVSGDLAWNDSSLTGTSFSANPQTATWEEGVNYARTIVTVDATNPILYVLQGGPAAANDEFDYHTLSAVQLVRLGEITPGDGFTVTYNANGGTGDVPVDDNVYADGTTITVMGQGNLTLAGESFIGWLDPETSDTFTPLSTFTMPERDVTLLALWSQGDTEPVILTQPESQVAVAGDTVSFAVTAIGSPEPTYQWYFEGNLIPDATDATLTLTNVSAADEGTYFVRVSNSFGLVDSDPATLTLLVPPPAPSGLTATSVAPTSVGLSWTDNSGGDASFEVRLANGTVVATTGPGVTSTTIGDLSPGTSYTFTVRAVNVAGSSADSNAVTVTTETIILHTVSFSANGGSGAVPASESVILGEAFTVPGPGDLTKAGHAFNGWRDVLGAVTYGAGDTFAMPARDVELAAQWTLLGDSGEYVQPFNNTNNQLVVENAGIGWQRAAHDGNLSADQVGRLSDANGPDGQPGFAYTFRGGNNASLMWYEGLTLSQDTLQAFSAYVGHSHGSNVIRFLIRVGDNWYASADGDGKAPQVGNATWFENGATPYTVNFSPENTWVPVVGFNGTSTGTFTLLAGGELTPLAALPAGDVTAVGVYLANLGGGSTRFDDFTVTWTAPGSGHTVTYAANGGTGAVPEDLNQYATGTTITVMGQGGVTREGYEFLGWRDEVAGETYAPLATFAMPERDVTLVAQWTADAADAYADWAAANNITGGLADETGGVANLLRYALGGGGTTPLAGLLPDMQSTPTVDGLTLSLTFHRIDDDAVTYAVWFSEDLVDWGTEPVWEATGAHEGEPGAYEVEVLVPAHGNRGFLRLEVTR